MHEVDTDAVSHSCSRRLGALGHGVHPSTRAICTTAVMARLRQFVGRIFAVISGASLT